MTGKSTLGKEEDLDMLRRGLKHVKVQDIEKRYFQEVHCSSITCKHNSKTGERVIPYKSDFGTCTYPQLIIVKRSVKVEVFPYETDPDIDVNWRSSPIPVCMEYRMNEVYK